MKWLTLIGLARGCLVNETSDNNGGIIFKIKMKLFLLTNKNAGIPVQQFQKPSNNPLKKPPKTFPGHFFTVF